MLLKINKVPDLFGVCFSFKKKFLKIRKILNVCNSILELQDEIKLNVRPFLTFYRLLRINWEMRQVFFSISRILINKIFED